MDLPLHPVKVALKIDVDTRIGTEVGLVNLRRLLGRLNIRASIFASFGPDNSGRAVLRVFRRRGFAGKMARTNPLRIYGLRTLLSGTFLPARPTGTEFPDLLRGLEADGHEVALHAWDHVLWHDRLAGWSEEEVAREASQGVEAFTRTLGRAPRAMGAAGWQASAASLRVQDRFALVYASDTRGASPFIPRVDQETFRTPQIPGTLPTADEVLGTGGITRANVFDHFLARMSGPGPHVFTGHAELEGMYLLDGFETFLNAMIRRGAEFTTLEALARSLGDAARLPVAPMVWGQIPGRAGRVACQGGTGAG